MTLLFLYASISIGFSFLCSILEAVLLSITPTFITVKKNEGKAYADTFKKLKNDVNKPLISILTVNTIAHTVGAIMVGVQAEKTFGSGNNAVGIVSAIMTLLILVLSEIIPKSIGATYWKQLANFSAKAITVLMFPLKYTGILWILELTTKLVGKNPHNTNVSREDFHAMADIKFSRIPLFENSPDEITGYFLKDQLLESIIDGKGNNLLKTISREILIIERNAAIKPLFDKFIEKHEHIALVVDEFGSLSGMVTQEDIIETLLGLEIVDESDGHEDLQALARKMWEIRAKRHGIIDDDKGKNKD